MATNAKQIENWGLFFPRNDNPETQEETIQEHEEVVKSLLNFLEDWVLKTVTFKSSVSVGGKNTTDGKNVFSKSLVSITRVLPYYGSNHELLRARDCDGNEFLFYSDRKNQSGYMHLMLADMKYKGELSRTPYFYVPNEYRYNSHWG